ncbi:YkyA family protein [Aerococcaceae bacterium WGS1372]
MKQLNKIVVVLVVSLILTGCNNAVERTNRLITLLQENITAIVNELTEIQLAENNLQAEFETTLDSGSDDFSGFMSNDSPIQQNIQRRKDHLSKLDEHRNDLLSLIEEVENQSAKTPLPVEQVNSHISQLNGLAEELSIYIIDYSANMDTESIIYKSLANPETDYTSFFSVFDRVAVLQTTNNINLERILGFFEPINTQLINFKVYLANLQENN